MRHCLKLTAFCLLQKAPPVVYEPRWSARLAKTVAPMSARKKNSQTLGGWESSILVSNYAHLSFCTVRLKHPTVGSWSKTFLLDPDSGAGTERSLYLKITAAVAYFWPPGAAFRKFWDITDIMAGFRITWSSHTQCCQVWSWRTMSLIGLNTNSTWLRFV